MLQKLIALLFVFTGIGASTYAQQQAWSLQQCVTYALDNNIQVKQSELNEQIAGNNYLQSKVNFSPSLNGDASYNVNFGRSVDPTTYTFVTQEIQSTSFSLSTNLTLFNGLQQINSVKQEKYNVLSAKYQTEEIENNIALSVTAAYLQILLSKEERKSIQTQINLSLDQLDQTQKMVENGMVPEGNLLDVQAQLANDSLNLVRAENNIDLSLLNLAQLLQLPGAEDFDIETPEIEIPSPEFLALTAEEVYQMALNQQPQVKRAEYDVLSAEKNVQIAKGLQSPIISAFANVRTNHSSLAQIPVEEQSITTQIGYVDDASQTPVLSSFNNQVFEKAPVFDQYGANFNQTLGLSMSVPLFNRLTTRTTIKNAKIQYEGAQMSKKQVTDQLKTDIYSAYTDAKSAYSTYISAKKNVEALSQTFDYIEKRFNLGAANTLEYSTAKTNLNNAQIQLVNAKYDYIFKLKVLEFYQGKPITIN